MSKGKMSKIGAVWTKNKDVGIEGPPNYSIKLGTSGNADPQYDRNVEITVTDGAGLVISKQTNGWLVLKDPRASTFLSAEQKAKIPATLEFDVLVGNN